MENTIPRDALALLSRLHSCGHEAYLVGGCIRDLLRGSLPSDYDITTSATPEEMLSVFWDHRVIPTGMKHGTLTVLRDGAPYEITTYRVDGEYADGRHPDEVRFTRSLSEDLARRDFTVNAIAYSPKDGIFDPFDGRADLSARLIRAVGDPMRRFTEDALRILRAIRFSATLGYALESETERAAYKLRHRLSLVSPERVRTELMKLLSGDGAERVLLSYSEILFAAIPELSLIGSSFEGAVRHAAQLPPEPMLRLFALLAPLGGSGAERVMTALRFDNASVRRAASAVSLLSAPLPSSETELLHLLSVFGCEALLDRIALLADEQRAKHLRAALDRVLEEKLPFSVSMLAIGGKDLLALGIPAGKELGLLLADALSAVMAREINNDKRELLAYVRRSWERSKSQSV